MMWRGLAIGILISAPMGPVGILCIQRTLDKGRRAGFYTGVGAALSDLFYALLTGFGLSFIEEFLERNSNIIQLVGSAVLIGFAVYLFRKNPARNLKKTAPETNVPVKKSILGGFLFTFSNPLILFLIIGLFARFNFLMPEIKFYHYIIGFIFILGGALLWWWLITFFVDKVRSHFNVRSMWLVNRIIAVIILIFALVGIVTGISSMASAKVVCFNATRGFQPIPADSAGRIPSGSTGAIQIDGSPSAMSLFIKYSGLSSSRRHTMHHGDSSVPTPAWTLSLSSADGHAATIAFTKVEYFPDAISSTPALRLDCIMPDGDISTLVLTKGFDTANGGNAFRLSFSDSRLAIEGGNRSFKDLAAFPLPAGFSPAMVTLSTSPDTRLTLEEINLRLPDIGRTASPADHPFSSLPGDRLLSGLDSLHRDAADPLSGYWRLLDYQLDDERMRLGGDYLLAIVPDDPEAAGREGEAYDGSYTILYINGCQVSPSAWRSGNPKGHLASGGLPGVWDVAWITATHRLLDREIKAQLETPATLRIHFPLLNAATMRFARCRTPRH